MQNSDKSSWRDFSLQSAKILADYEKAMRELELEEARALRDQESKSLDLKGDADESPLSYEDLKENNSSPDTTRSDNEEIQVYEDDTSTEGTLNAIELRRKDTLVKNQEQNLALRKRIANVAMWGVGGQMVITDVLFGFHLNAVDFQPDPTVIIAWMTSTVVQIVGIAMVVTRNLFPSRNGDSKKDEESDL